MKFGQEFVIDTLSVDEYEPTFKFRNISGHVQHLGDSVWFQVPHFDLPASTGNGHGKVWWGSDRPGRYDIAIRGDSVSLDDVNWVYPTLPRTRRRTLDLADQERSEESEQIVDFKLSKMDVHSTKSHLTGDMSFGTGAPVLLVRNVDLRADPVNFDLLRTLAGKPFPQDWQGDLIGTVKARGGPLTNFVVDDAQGDVPRRARARRGVALLGQRRARHPLSGVHRVPRISTSTSTSLDLRTIEYLYPELPAAGRLRVRHGDARFVVARRALLERRRHASQTGPASRRTSRAAAASRTATLMTYDVALDAQPLSLTMLARSPKVFPGRSADW